MSDSSGWVAWFADAVGGAGRAQQQLIGSIERLHATWLDRLHAAGLRSDAAAGAALELLPRHLLLTATEVAAALGITAKGARAALSGLADAASSPGSGRCHRAGVAGPPTSTSASNSSAWPAPPH